MEEKEFDKKQAEMSDNELLNQVSEQISNLARTRGRSHKMTVPARIDDTDMLFSELLRRYKRRYKQKPEWERQAEITQIKEQQQEWDALKKQVETVKKERDQALTVTQKVKEECDELKFSRNNYKKMARTMEAEAGRLRIKNIKLENTIKELDKGMAEEMAKGKPPKPKFVLQSNPRDGLVFPQPLKGLVKERDMLKKERGELKEEVEALRAGGLSWSEYPGQIPPLFEIGELKEEVRRLKKDYGHVKKEREELKKERDELKTLLNHFEKKACHFDNKYIRLCPDGSAEIGLGSGKKRTFESVSKLMEFLNV